MRPGRSPIVFDFTDAVLSSEGASPNASPREQHVAAPHPHHHSQQHATAVTAAMGSRRRSSFDDGLELQPIHPSGLGGASGTLVAQQAPPLPSSSTSASRRGTVASFRAHSIFSGTSAHDSRRSSSLHPAGALPHHAQGMLLREHSSVFERKLTVGGGGGSASAKPSFLAPERRSSLLGRRGSMVHTPSTTAAGGGVADAQHPTAATTATTGGSSSQQPHFLQLPRSGSHDHSSNLTAQLEPPDLTTAIRRRSVVPQSLHFGGYDVDVAATREDVDPRPTRRRSQDRSFALTSGGGGILALTSSNHPNHNRASVDTVASLDHRSYAAAKDYQDIHPYNRFRFMSTGGGGGDATPPPRSGFGSPSGGETLSLHQMGGGGGTTVSSRTPKLKRRRTTTVMNTDLLAIHGMAELLEDISDEENHNNDTTTDHSGSRMPKRLQSAAGRASSASPSALSKALSAASFDDAEANHNEAAAAAHLAQQHRLQEKEEQAKHTAEYHLYRASLGAIPLPFVVAQLTRRIEHRLVMTDFLYYIPFLLVFTLFFLSRDIEEAFYASGAIKKLDTKTDYVPEDVEILEEMFRLDTHKYDGNEATYMSDDGTDIWDYTFGPQIWRLARMAKIPEKKSLLNIKTRQALLQYFNGPFVRGLWDCTNENYHRTDLTRLFGNTVALGALRLRSVRVLPTPCEGSLRFQKIYCPSGDNINADDELTSGEPTENNSTTSYSHSASATLTLPATLSASPSLSASASESRTDSAIWTITPPPTATTTTHSLSATASGSRSTTASDALMPPPSATIRASGTESVRSSPSLSLSKTPTPPLACSEWNLLCYGSIDSDLVDRSPTCASVPHPARPNKSLIEYLECDRTYLSAVGIVSQRNPCEGHVITLPFAASCGEVREALRYITPSSNVTFDWAGVRSSWGTESETAVLAERLAEGPTKESNASLCTAFALHNAVRLITVDYFAYSVSLDYFFHSHTNIEFSLGGSLVVSHSIKGFRVWTSSQIFPSVLQLTTIAFVIHFVLRMLTDWRTSKRHSGSWFTYPSDAWNLLDIVVNVTLVTSAILAAMWWSSSLGFTVRFNTDTEYPTELEYIENLHTTQVYCNAVTVVLVYLKVLKFLRVNDRLSIMTRTLAKCQADIFSLLLLFFFIHTAFALMGNVIYGAYLSEYRSFDESFSTLLFAMLGEVNYQAMRLREPTMTPIFFWSFVSLETFILLNFFIAILGEGFAQVNQSMNLPPLDVALLRLVDEIRMAFRWRHVREQLLFFTTAQSKVGALVHMHACLEEHLSLSLAAAADYHVLIGREHVPMMHFRDLKWWLPSEVMDALGVQFLLILWEDLVYAYNVLEKGSSQNAAKSALAEVVARGLSVVETPDVLALEVQAEAILDKLEQLPLRLVEYQKASENAALWLQQQAAREMKQQGRTTGGGEGARLTAREMKKKQRMETNELLARLNDPHF